VANLRGRLSNRRPPPPGRRPLLLVFFTLHYLEARTVPPSCGTSPLGGSLGPHIRNPRAETDSDANGAPAPNCR